MVRARKVLYLGVSDTPARIVSKANQYARDLGLWQFVVYQGEWSARSFPCVRMSRWACAHGVLLEMGSSRAMKIGEKVKRAVGQGLCGAGEAGQGERREHHRSCFSLCHAQSTVCFPICSGRKTDHLKGNIDAPASSLSNEEMAGIDNAWPFDVGFPDHFCVRAQHQSGADS